MVTIVIPRDYLHVLSLTPNATAYYFLGIEFKGLGSFLQREISNTFVSGGEKEPKTLKRRKEDRDSKRSCFYSSSWGLGPRGEKCQKPYLCSVLTLNPEARFKRRICFSLISFIINPREEKIRNEKLNPIVLGQQQRRENEILLS